MNIVTCSDKNYIPGVIALYNSFQLVSLEEGMRRTVEYFNEYLKTTNQK